MADILIDACHSLLVTAMDGKLLSERVEATWNGGASLADLAVTTPRTHTAISNFGRGVLTFDVPFIFRTERGYNIMAGGPSNEFKDGAAPLTAIIETDWLPYTFTMNYQFTRPSTVIWEKDEPYCQIAVVPVELQETVEPEIQRIEQNPALLKELEAWTCQRTEFRSRQEREEPEAIKQAWQRFYFKGEYPDGRVAQAHQFKLRLNPVEDKR